MHVLGIACGSRHGNNEILLTAALNAATAARPGTTASMIRLSDLSLPPVTSPSTFEPGKSNAAQKPTEEQPDHGVQALDSILEADGLILASPVYTRQTAGLLKYFCDRVLGHFVDAAFVATAVEGKKKGDARFADARPDKRVLKPRVAGLMAVGGAVSEEWGTLALPMLHQCVFSLHCKVVDQLHVWDCGAPGSVLLGAGDAVAQAERLGRRVASQLGLQFDAARFLGDEQGCCPHCHLDVIALHKADGNAAHCAGCGALGTIELGSDNKLRFAVLEQPVTSVVTMAGKMRHMHEIEASRELVKLKLPSIEEERKRYAVMSDSLAVSFK